MTLLRAASRTMLASYFVTSGYKAYRQPDVLVPAAEPVADRLVPLVKKYAPQVGAYVPEDTRTLVRVNGAAQVLGGLALASGKGRRLGAVVLAASLVPSTLAKYPFWTRTTPEEKAQDRTHFLKNVSLLGGVLLAAGDTEGRPSLVWRAQKGGELLARDARKTTKRISRTTGVTAGALTKGAAEIADTVGELAGNVSKSTTHLTEGAVASGAALVGAAVSGSRAARKKAAKQLKERQIAAAKQVKLAQAAAVKQAKVHQKRKAKQAKVDERKNARLAKVAERQSAKQAKIDERENARLAKVAERQSAKQAVLDQKADLKQAKAAEKANLRAIAKAEKKANKAQRHIERGEN